MKALWLALRRFSLLFGSQRKLWIPFLITALVEVFFLVLVWLAPHPPFSVVLAPPIRFFSSDRVLHYPWHLWYLFYVMKHTHLLATFLAGAFMSGVASVMVRQAHQQEPLSLGKVIAGRQVSFVNLVLVWVVTWAAAEAALKGLNRLFLRSSWDWIGIAAAILLQLTFAYAITAAALEKYPWWKAVPASIKETLKFPLSTFFMMLLPAALLMIFAVFVTPGTVARVVLEREPELAIAFAAARLGVWFLADTLFTVGMANLWLLHRNLVQ